MSLIRIGLACLLLLPVSGAQATQKTPRLAQFTVPAGTALSIELRTGMRSDDARASQQITGRLTLPLFSGSLEVVPAGSTVHGAIETVTAAGRSAPGRLEFAFQVIEHPETGSRATIRTSRVTFEGERIKKKRIFGMTTTEMTDVKIEEGEVVSCSLLAPLLVFIPRDEM